MARLNGTIDTDSYDVSAWRGYRGETGFTVGSSNPTTCSSITGS